MHNYEIDLSFLKPYRNLILLTMANIFLLYYMGEELLPHQSQEQIIYNSKSEEYQEAQSHHQIIENQISNIEESLPEFETLLEHGLYNSQDRLGAAAVIEDVRVVHGLSYMDYEFENRSEYDITHNGRGYRKFETNIELGFEIGDNDDVFQIIDDLKIRLGGYVGITALKLSSQNRVNLSLVWLSIDPANLEEDAEIRSRL